MASLHESIGLLAYYESQPLTGNTPVELSRNRSKMLNDFASSKKDDDIKYLLWVMNKYPEFLHKLLTGKAAFKSVPKEIKNKKQEILETVSSKSKKSVNKLVDKIVQKSTKNILVKKYISTKMNQKEFDPEDIVAQNDSEEILKFLISYEQKYNDRVMEMFNIDKYH